MYQCSLTFIHEFIMTGHLCLLGNYVMKFSVFGIDFNLGIIFMLITVQFSDSFYITDCHHVYQLIKAT